MERSRIPPRLEVDDNTTPWRKPKFMEKKKLHFSKLMEVPVELSHMTMPAKEVDVCVWTEKTGLEIQI